MKSGVCLFTRKRPGSERRRVESCAVLCGRKLIDPWRQNPQPFGPQARFRIMYLEQMDLPGGNGFVDVTETFAGAAQRTLSTSFLHMDQQNVCRTRRHGDDIR